MSTNAFPQLEREYAEDLARQEETRERIKPMCWACGGEQFIDSDLQPIICPVCKL